MYASGSRNASHPVNAILNYAYAVLQSQMQIKLVADGYDPMLGIMHYDRDGAPAFVSDLMEPERPKVGRAMHPVLRSEPSHPRTSRSGKAVLRGSIRSWRGRASLSSDTGRGKSVESPVNP